MQWLANVSVRRPIFASVLMLGTCVLGMAGYFQLGVDRFPDVNAPFITVTTRLPGAAPEEIETEVTEELEESLNTISGIDELRSQSSEGTSLVFISFNLGKDVDVAAQEVRDRVNLAVPRMPKDIEQPTITRVDPGATPALFVAVNGKLPLREMTDIADKLVRPQIENVSGVGEVVVLGGRKRQINIWIDPLKLRAFDLTALDVQRTVGAQNLSLPTGSLEAAAGQTTLRLQGRVQDAAEVGRLVVRDTQGRAVRVEDVARVEDGQEEGESLAFRNGTRGVVLSVRKQADANTVSVVDEVRERLNELGPKLPNGITLEVARDNSATIRTSIHAVQEHLILGALFAALTVLLFLGHLRSTLIAALAIPISLIGTFALMWLQGFTLNVITLLALALAVGIVIDDAIVVLENVFRFVNEKKLSPRRAAIQATQEIGLAVLATTLSLLAVFLPVAFMGGIVGRFLKSFGLTMSYAIAISLFVSFTLTPMLASKWLTAARPHAQSQQKPLLERVVDWFYVPVENVYMRLLGWVMRRRWVVVVASLLCVAATVPLMGVVKKGFLPDSDEAHFEINLRAPEGTNLEGTGLIAERIAREVRQLKGVEFTLTTLGDNAQEAPNVGAVYVKLSDPKERKESQVEIMERVRREVLSHKPADLKADVSEVPVMSGGMSQAMVMYDLSGPELVRLEEYSEKIVAAVEKVPGAVDVSSTMVSGKPELSLSIDRERAADLGVSVADLAATLQLLVGGSKVGTYERDGDQLEIRARADRDYRADAESLRTFSVPSSKFGAVLLSDVVSLRAGKGPAQINRLARRRQVTLLANVAPGASEGAVVQGVVRAIEAQNLPSGYAAMPQGRSKEMAKAGQSFLIAFVLAIVFMYLTLAAQFESWLHPATILLALPLTLPFAILSLVLLDQSLNIFSALGILVLFAVVKKNAILQIDHANHLRAEGIERGAAILQANKDRLRPILMTTLAFVAGMIPLVFSDGVGAGFNQATAGVVVGGQVLSLLLTLVATPVAYSLFDDLAARFGRKPMERPSIELAPQA
ncbi:MAG TPA: efflux RND transporter permease subunit [Polyangiales bacterium]|nr:efflux RND transporter permease subunit [Polyangiales bacterium]